MTHDKKCQYQGWTKLTIPCLVLLILQNYIVAWEQGVVRFCVGRFDIYYWFGLKRLTKILQY